MNFTTINICCRYQPPGWLECVDALWYCFCHLLQYPRHMYSQCEYHQQEVYGQQASIGTMHIPSHNGSWVLFYLSLGAPFPAQSMLVQEPFYHQIALVKWYPGIGRPHTLQNQQLKIKMLAQRLILYSKLLVVTTMLEFIFINSNKFSGC